MTAPGTQHPLALLETLRKQSETLLRDTHDVGQRSYGAGMRSVLDELEPALRAEAEAWGVEEAIATADPPIGAQEARIFAQKALAQAQAGATETTLRGTTMKHEFPIGARITLFLTACPIDDTTDGEDEHEFRDEPAIVVECLNGDPAADYLVYVPKTRRVYPCVPADMAH